MAEPVGSPLWWVEHLSDQLDARATKVREFEAWYDGAHPIPNPPPNTLAHYDRDTRIAFNNLARLGITNFMAPVVDVPAAKLGVEGFRFGEGSETDDTDAWTIWQRNQLDAESDIQHTTIFKTGQGFVLVWADEDGLAEITLEDPAQTIVAYVPGTRRKRAAGLKRWRDETSGSLFATLYLPGGVYKFQGPATDQMPTDDPVTYRNETEYSFFQLDQPVAELILPAGVSRWRPRTVDGEAWPLANPLDEVPLVEFPINGPIRRPTYGGGFPEFAGQLTTQRRINQTMLNMLITMEHQAFRQRWVVGWTPPKDKTTGEVDKLAVLKAGASNLWVFDGENVKTGEFGQADFSPFLAAIDRDVKNIASTSATPPYAFLIGDMINVAADSLARIEGQLTSKVKVRQRTVGEAWEEVMRLALAVESNPKADDIASSIVWAEIEERTATEQFGLASAMKALGAPPEAYFAALPGIDQQTAARWAAELEAEPPEPVGPPEGQPPATAAA